VGWILLGAWLCVTHRCLTRRFTGGQDETFGHPAARWAPGLCALFPVALFMAWSPVDIWQPLPDFLKVAQFPYRLLAQVMWLGRGLAARHLVLGALVIVSFSSSYLPTLERGAVRMQDVLAAPDIGYGAGDYLWSDPAPRLYGEQQLPLSTSDGWLLLDTAMPWPADLRGSRVVVHLVGAVPDDWFPNGMTLRAMLGDDVVAARTLGQGPVDWQIPVDLSAAGADQGLHFVADPVVVPARRFPPSGDERHLAITVSSLALEGLPPERSIIPVSATRPAFRQDGPRTVGTLTGTPTADIAQLPALYYPGLQDVRVDGAPSATMPVGYQSVELVGVPLAPGTHAISVVFTGLPLANWLSLTSWVLTLACLALLLARRCGLDPRLSRLNRGV
jgi:hypothetical protein